MKIFEQMTFLGVKKTMSKLKEGKETSEFAMLHQVKWLSWITIALGAFLAIGPQIMDSVQGTTAGTWLGGAMMIAGQISKVLAFLGYNSGRAEVKKADALATAKKK